MPSVQNEYEKEPGIVEKIWLKSYPPGVPAEINPDAYSSLVEIFQKSCREYHDRPAFYNLGVTLTYAEIDALSRNFAAYLQQDLQLKKGDRFAIMLPNVLQYPIALFGALRAGLIIINVNPLYTVDELTYQLNNARADVLIVLDHFAHTVQSALPRVPHLKQVIVSQLGDLFSPLKNWYTHIALKYFYKKIPNWSIPHAITFKEVLSQGQHRPFMPIVFENTDTAFLQYTGGTTGVSKGAVLTHRNIISNIQQADAWFRSLLSTGKEIVVTALPLYHIFSLTANCMFFIKEGGLNILITNPRDIASMIKEMKKFKFTAITGVNTLFNALLKHPSFSALDFSQLRLALGGGMAVQQVIADKWQQVTHSPLLEAYGLTETSPCVTINPVTLTAYNGSIGLPVPSTDIAILDDDGNELPVGAVGELAVKGPQVMQGYWENPVETQKVFTKEGWLLTGDVASVDEKGFVRLLERKKDMVLVSGFNVYPNEVENVIALLPGVKEVAVIGIPDEHTGEMLKAFIVKDFDHLTAEAVITHARQHLTPYKVPKHIEFCEELPKSNIGKILRRELREREMAKRTHS